jgi:hypothetical protein
VPPPANVKNIFEIGYVVEKSPKEETRIGICALIGTV